MKDQLFADMLGDRLDEVGQSANPPFLAVPALTALPTPTTKDEATLEALVSNGGVTRGLDALITELQRVSRFGFTATELARAKQSMMLSYERSVTESPDRESASRADEYTRNFLQSEALPTIWQELAFHRRFLPDITLTEMNALSGEWFPTRNRLVVVSAPEAADAGLPGAAQLAAAVETASARKLEPHVDSAAGLALMDAPPQAGTIVKTTLHAETGITEWTRSNGATVVLKPTTLREDQILFRATAPATSPPPTPTSFRAHRGIGRLRAAGRFNAVTLDKLLSGKAIAVRPFIGELDEG
jgi:zinc protease